MARLPSWLFDGGFVRLAAGGDGAGVTCMVRDKANFSDSMKMLIAIDIAFTCCFTLHNDGSYSVSVYVVVP